LFYLWFSESRAGLVVVVEVMVVVVVVVVMVFGTLRAHRPIMKTA